MIKKLLKPSAILMAILILASQASFTVLPVMGAGSASLSLGEVTLRNGCPSSIPINVNTGGEAIWAADVALFVTGEASVDSLALGSALPMQACNDSSVPEIMLCGARQAGTGAFTGTGVYGTINITPEDTGVLSLSFNDKKTNLINDVIQDVLGEATGANYNVEEQFNVGADGVGFCNPDTVPPVINVDPNNGKNNVPVDTSVKLTLSDNRVGIDLSTLTFSVNGIDIDTFSYTKTGGTYTPFIPFDLGEKVDVEVRVCDLEANCKEFSGSFRTTPPLPPPNCGDKNVDEDEECDEGHQTDTCDRDCSFVACGDGVINDVAGEQCDDFNENDGDGCSSICTLEVPIEDLLYCPVLKPAAPPEEVSEEGEGDSEVPEDGEEDQEEQLPEEEFEEEDFQEAASSAVAESPLRPAAAAVLLPVTSEDQEEIDPCILKYGTEGASLDHDGDGLSDRTECYSGTDPDNADTDGDTCFDGEEINHFYTDPLAVDCSISNYVEEEVLIIDPKPNWILTKLTVSGSTPRRSLTVGITAFPAIQKTFSQVLTQYEDLLSVLKRDVDLANTVAIQQQIGDMTDSITKLQASIKDTQEFVDENPENYAELAGDIKRVTAFLDGGTAAVSTELEQAENLFKALEEHKTESIFLGEINELQTVGVGNTTTAGFNLESKKELEDGVYDLVATAGFEDGGTKSSAPVRIYISSTIEVGVPLPQTLDGIPIGLEKIVTDNQRPVLSGKSVYGAMVFATWESIVLESSIIADSDEGNFDIQSPRNLEVGEEHTVTMYAVTETDGGFVRSENTTVDFVIEKTSDSTIYYYTFGMAAFLLLTGGLNFAIGRLGRRKRH